MFFIIIYAGQNKSLGSVIYLKLFLIYCNLAEENNSFIEKKSRNIRTFLGLRTLPSLSRRNN